MRALPAARLGQLRSLAEQITEVGSDDPRDTAIVDLVDHVGHLDLVVADLELELARARRDSRLVPHRPKARAA